MTHMTTLREIIAIQICEATSGGEGLPGIHKCECRLKGWTTECVDMLKAADGALAAIGCTRGDSMVAADQWPIRAYAEDGEI